ncbi:large ribosomal subunit protein mL51-like [Saccostrea echinata]|uniref:large ribosomal subunit protein mL51-like n=1 Tax=Saccostrea echinata TaxID=191078 RepID=UPI002A8085F9|nr:large ribosomal subunit protein mL51-like [Saccostrea echinata]
MFLMRKLGTLSKACANINVNNLTGGLFKQQEYQAVSFVVSKLFHGSPVNFQEPEQDAVTIGVGDRKYEPQSPYRRLWPKRFQFVTKTRSGPTLPRVDKAVSNKLPFKYKEDSVRWALQGANDYIDILGDGDIHPVDLIKGPPYLIGFNANELGRLNRKLRFEGRFIEDNYPSKLEKILKRIRFLKKKYNYRRGKRVRKRFKYR